MRKLSLLLALAGAMAPGAQATNGYLAPGIGLKAKGMAGAGLALPEDALAAALNPAGLLEVGDRLDVGAEWSRLDHGASISGNASPSPFNGDYSGRVPARAVAEFGISRALAPGLAAGFAAYGNRFASRYEPSPFTTGLLGSLGGHLSGPSGASIEQRFAAGTVAYRPAPGHSVGASVIHARQRFAAEGLDPYRALSGEPASLGGAGPASGGGWGVRLGWSGQLREDLTVAATWASRIRTRLDAYRGIFPDGRLDIPESFGLGVALRPAPGLALAADWQRIRFSQAVGGASDCLLALRCTFGAGAGFGWRDMNVMRLGGSYEAGGGLTVRAGASVGRAPIAENQTLLNIVLPAVTEKHLSVGATWQIDHRGEVSIAYTRGFGNTMAGASSISGPLGQALGGGEANLRARSDAFAAGVGIRF